MFEEWEELSGLTPARVFRERYQLESELSATPSPLGAQLEVARSEAYQDRGSGGCSRDGFGEKQLRHATLVLLCRDLNVQEAAAARLYYWDLRTPGRERKALRIGDLRPGDGTDVLLTAPRGPDGTTMDGFAICSTVVQLAPSLAAVTERMVQAGHRGSDGQPVKPGAVRRRLSDARRKVADSIRWRIFQSLTNGT